MSKRYRCKPKVVKVLCSNKGNSDYDKLPKAIVRIKNKSKNKMKWYELIDFVFIIIFSLIGVCLFTIGILIMPKDTHTGANLVMLSIFISTVPIFTYLAPKAKKTSVKISLVVAVVSVISFIKDFLIAMYF